MRVSRRRARRACPPAGPRFPRRRRQRRSGAAGGDPDAVAGSRRLHQRGEPRSWARGQPGRGGRVRRRRALPEPRHPGRGGSLSAIARAFGRTPGGRGGGPRLLDSGIERSRGRRPGGLVLLRPRTARTSSPFSCACSPRSPPTRGSCCSSITRSRTALRAAGRDTPSEDRERAIAVEQAAAAALADPRTAFRSDRGLRRTVRAGLVRGRGPLRAAGGGRGTILYSPEARFRHRGGESSRRLGYDRFLPIVYRNALRYRARPLRRAARLAYRLLLAAGMKLRLGLLPSAPAACPASARRGGPRLSGASSAWRSLGDSDLATPGAPRMTRA